MHWAKFQICVRISEATKGFHFRAGIRLCRAVLRLQVSSCFMAIAALVVEIRMCEVAIVPIGIQCFDTLLATKCDTSSGLLGQLEPIIMTFRAMV